MSHIRRDVPLAIVSNFAEAHRDFLNRSPAPANGGAPLATQEAYHADRTLLWAGDPKLVIVSYPIPHANYLFELLGYARTSHAAPQNPSDCLSRDILDDEALLRRLIAHAGPDKMLQLVPYAVTPEFCALAEALRREHGLRVLLPEHPQPHAIWLRDFIDTKAGFHHLAGRWLPNAGDLLPEAHFCHDLAQAARIVRWFTLEGKACIAKPDTGESGIGSVVVRPGDIASEQEALTLLKQQPYWGRDLIVVEEYCASDLPVSPSVEVFVPPLHNGEPAVTYVCEQLFRGLGEFSGVIVSAELRERPWYGPCVDSALTIARQLQRRGYAGHFDLDAVVDGDGRPRLLEINARRTGGTHVHDFATFAFGPDYLERVALLSWESIHSAGITDYTGLRTALDDLLYPIGGSPRGVILTITSSLQHHQFGVLIAGDTAADAVALQTALLDRIQQHANAKTADAPSYI
ncbi:MAG: hypothetical protein QM346_07450 [Chloroflexota bacterium]|nr:hypothetical protein [Chloroflexota bacterium]